MRNRFLNEMLECAVPGAQPGRLWRAGKPTGVMKCGLGCGIEVPFIPLRPDSTDPDVEISPSLHTVIVRAYGDSVVRVTLALSGEVPGTDSIMLQMAPDMAETELSIEETGTGWRGVDSEGRTRFVVNNDDPPMKPWQPGMEPWSMDYMHLTILPDGTTEVPFMARDHFNYAQHDSISMGYLERQSEPERMVFSLYARPQERFAGTGERFARQNLSGKTLYLENMDGLGNNSWRCYKNVPFYVSDKPYGLLTLTSSHVRLSLADISTRAVQGVIEDDVMDLFVIGGGSVEAVVRGYRMLTGFPPEVPLWSYGVWMSRMTYFTAEEVRTVGRKLRDKQLPCDVLHVDTGWFARDWRCEWEFGERNFPDPAGFMKEMFGDGFRITLWQLPFIGKDNMHWDTAVANGYVAPKSTKEGSDFGDIEYGGTLDFSNPAAVEWYKGLLRRLLRMGAAAIKTDFGEQIDLEAEYHGMPSSRLHNLYALLYQKAAYEVTKEVTGDGLVWARAGWTGCQRYPIHWAGDSAATWDGMAGAIRGGLHLGLSGYGYWSHDIPGFQGMPDFMCSWPSSELYVRWTQLGTFTSHMRYHGTNPREPYEYPEIEDTIRQWWRLRYALIPYLADQGRRVTESGLPLFRSLVFSHAHDPLCWEMDDEFMCGDDILVAPVVGAGGVRDVYLPQGSWVDFWTGELMLGPVMMKGTSWDLSRCPVYVREGASLPVYTEAVAHTGQMDMGKVVRIMFDATYKGLRSSVLGTLIDM